MGYNMNRTASYVMTAHCESAGDMLEIQTIRNTVKAINNLAKETDSWNQYRVDCGYDDYYVKSPRYRVSLKARGPRAIHAIKDGKHPRAYDQSLPFKYAEKFDVYIHRK